VAELAWLAPAGARFGPPQHSWSAPRAVHPRRCHQPVERMHADKSVGARMTPTATAHALGLSASGASATGAVSPLDIVLSLKENSGIPCLGGARAHVNGSAMAVQARRVAPATPQLHRTPRPPADRAPRCAAPHAHRRERGPTARKSRCWTSQTPG
jgi:hypothetical protein